MSLLFFFFFFCVHFSYKPPSTCRSKLCAAKFSSPARRSFQYYVVNAVMAKRLSK